jgi:hypothetical protein
MLCSVHFLDHIFYISIMFEHVTSWCEYQRPACLSNIFGGHPCTFVYHNIIKHVHALLLVCGMMCFDDSFFFANFALTIQYTGTFTSVNSYATGQEKTY